jgi:hypothetical protein
MMTWFRHQLRPLAATVLVWLAALGAWSTVAHGAECHDEECAPAIVAHDASAHVFDTAQPAVDAHGVHCILCHWVRTVRPPASATHVLPAVASCNVRVYIADVRASRGATAAQPPLRAPPGSLARVFFA